MAEKPEVRRRKLVNAELTDVNLKLDGILTTVGKINQTINGGEGDRIKDGLIYRLIAIETDVAEFKKKAVDNEAKIEGQRKERKGLFWTVVIGAFLTLLGAAVDITFHVHR